MRTSVSYSSIIVRIKSWLSILCNSYFLATGVSCWSGLHVRLYLQFKRKQLSKIRSRLKFNLACYRASLKEICFTFTFQILRGLNRFPGLISRVAISNINHCNIQLSGYHRASRMRKPKPELYREAHLYQYFVLHIHSMHIHRRGLGAFGKVRAVARPLKIHVALEQFGLMYPMPVPFQPNSLSFIIHPGRLPSSRAEINIRGKSTRTGK